MYRIAAFTGSLLAFLAVSTAHSSIDEFVMVTGAKAPYSQSDTSGFLDRLAGEAFLRLGHSVKVTSLPPPRALRNASAGVAYGDMQRIKGLDKTVSGLVPVPEAISSYAFTGFALKPLVKEIHLKDLKSMKVGYLRGWKFYELNIPNDTFAIVADRPEQLFALLKLGRIDIALFSRWSGFYWAKQVKLIVHAANPPFETIEMYMYLNIKNKELAPKLARSLKSMKRDGTYDRIHAETLQRNAGS